MPPAWHAGSDRMFGDDWPTGGYHTWLAQRVEEAGFDFLFFEDTAGVSRKIGGSIEMDLRHVLSAPKNDPVALITYLAGKTERLGLIATGSTTLYPPFLLARLYSTIDSLSNGRVGWNIVTSSEDEAAQNFGLDALPPTNERYAIADEFLEVVTSLWDSWDPDAIVKDLENNIYTDPSKVREINHVGEHFKVRGPLNTYPSPQHRPVFAQAGGSPRGREFAARHAELIMSVTVGGVDEMKEFREDMHARMRALGRDPREARIVYALHPYIFNNPAERRASITDNQLIPVLGKHGAHLGIDLLEFDLDKPLPLDLEVNGTTSMFESLREKARRGVSLREAIIDFHWGPDDVGTAGPAADVARNLIDTMEEVGGDGYIFMCTQDANRSVLDGVFDELVPELKRLGAWRTDFPGKTFRENLLAF